jgi:hypothetical protein
MPKQNKLHLFILLTCLLFGGVSCNKYEEGPCISLRSSYKRLIGLYELEYLYINGIDSTSAFKNQNCNGTIGFGPISETRVVGELVFFSYNADSTSDCSIYGTWGINRKKNSLGIKRYHDPSRHGITPVGPFLKYGLISWEIIKLGNNKLWLELNENGSTTWVHLKNLD